MYRPHFKQDHNGIPYLSKKEICDIAENYVRDFSPEILYKPQPLDVEAFLEFYLGLTLDYQYLSHDGRYLGMTVFNDTNKVVIYKPEENCADYLSVKHGTVIIDNTLLADNMEHPYRFTAGHESGQWVFHRKFHGYNPDQLCLFEEEEPFIQCKEVNQNYSNTNTKTWDNKRWMEWHADKFSSGLLMPETAVMNLLKLKNFSPEYFTALVSETFNVSKKAAFYRLCDLKILKSDFDLAKEQTQPSIF